MSHPSTLPPTTTTRGEKKLEESDEDAFKVPDMEERTKSISQGSLQSCNNNNNNGGEVGPIKRRRGRNPADKEYRRLKRLLRNRVSAQQAREKKKVYVNELESRANELQENTFRLQEKISIVTNENTMLRKILMNTRPKVDDNEEVKLG
ncbi:hypothetical protein RND81_05G136100 [Saponaria officinalis]|uniref:BZIP domain-containing protein n=1 Tax=Saponaria officinalis TaxID=3572 RepID=A0AAW1KWA2_SAPOF